MIIYGGKEIVRMNKSLKNERAEELDEYAVLKNKLDKYCLPKKNKHHAKYTFIRMKQERGEQIGSYVSRLREKVNDCEFGETVMERILEQCIQSIDNKGVNKKSNQQRMGTR